MLKLLISTPVLTLACCLLLRWLATPSYQSPAVAESDPSGAIATEPTKNKESPYLTLARRIFEEGTKASVNTRAVQLFTIAQSKQEGAIVWTAGYCRKTANEVGELRRKYGVISGEAVQFGEFLNRSAELSACVLAYHWALNGGVATDKTTVNPALIQTYFEDGFYGNQ